MFGFEGNKLDLSQKLPISFVHEILDRNVNDLYVKLYMNEDGLSLAELEKMVQVGDLFHFR